MLGHRPSAEATDRALSALSHPCRRRLLFELYEEVNTGEGNSIKYSRLDPYDSDQRRLELQHIHLPKLEAAGYINWDESDETIQQGRRWDEVEPLLELIYSHLCDLPVSFQGKPPSPGGMES